MPRSLKARSAGSVVDRLIETAEQLYGQHGLTGVSLRQICTAAGAGNNNAVQYHFGDAAGLIRAIHTRRLVENEIRRAQLLAKAEARNRLSVRDLVEVLYLPIIEAVDTNGKRSYARFLFALHSAPTGVQYTINLMPLMPAAQRAMELLHDAISELPAAVLFERNRLIIFLILASILNPRKGSSDAATVANAFDMAVGALTALPGTP